MRERADIDEQRGRLGAVEDTLHANAAEGGGTAENAGPVHIRCGGIVAEGGFGGVAVLRILARREALAPLPLAAAADHDLARNQRRLALTAAFLLGRAHGRRHG